MDQNLRYEIGRQAKWQSTRIKQNSKTKLLITLICVATSLVQEYDHDIADSSLPPNHKISQLPIQLSSQQKKTRSELQSKHARYSNQDIWLGFHTMELIAKTNDTPLQEIHTPIRELIRKGYKENEAAKIHTAKVSFPKIPQLKWPSVRLDGHSGHHYHLTQVPSDIEVNTHTGFALVYHILLNFEKPTTVYTSHEITDMTKARI